MSAAPGGTTPIRVRVRRPVASVLVLLRAEGDVEQAVLAAARDLGLPQGRHREVRTAAPHQIRLACRPRALGRLRVPLACVHHRRAGVRHPVPDLRSGRAAHSAVPRHRGQGRISRRRFPFRRMGPRRRPHRQAGGGDRNWRKRHPDRAGNRQERQRSCSSTSARRRGWCRGPTSRSRRRAERAFANVPGLRAAVRAGIYWGSRGLGFAYDPSARAAASSSNWSASGTSGAHVKDKELRAQADAGLSAAASESSIATTTIRRVADPKSN